MNSLDLLDRPIAYHRVFVTLTGSVKAAVLLSQAVYWQKRAKQADGWWYKTAEEWTEETGLSKHEQDTARRDCEKYLKTDLRSVPATLFWHVDEEALSQDLFGENSKTSFTESAKLDLLKQRNIKRNTETTTETTSKPNIMDEILSQVNSLQEREKKAIDAFESAFHLERPWNWYPARTTDERTWKGFRAYIVEKYEADPQCFSKYVTWRNQPYCRGSMSTVAIKRNPENFPDSWVMFLASESMYGDKQAPQYKPLPEDTNVYVKNPNHRPAS